MWQVVLEPCYDMVGGSVTEALKEMVSWLEALIGEWLSDDAIMASWVEHIVRKIQVQWNLVKSHDKYVEDKVVGLKIEVHALVDDYKAMVQAFEGDIAILKKTMW